MSHEEIAKETGMTVGAVRMCISRALRKLRSHGLAEEMLSLAIALDANRKGEPQ